jgi:hypothetical protein
VNFFHSSYHNLLLTALFQNSLRAGDVAQVIGCLLSKHEALASNPSATKKKKSEMSSPGT